MITKRQLNIFGFTAVTNAAGSLAASAIAGYGQKKVDLEDTAVASGNFITLSAALEASGLVDTLKGDGPFTVFAPSDEAFARFPDGTVASLLSPAFLILILRTAA